MTDHTIPRMPKGKRQLLDAAQRLLASQSQARQLSLRELSREAGLNHNTFYRHFADLDALEAAMIHDYRQRLLQGIELARTDTSSDQPMTHRVVGWLFDFADQHRDLVLTSYRILHGPASAVRAELEALLNALSADMLQEQRALNLIPPEYDELWLRALRLYVRRIYDLQIDYLEQPEKREALLAEAGQILALLLAGTRTMIAALDPKG